MGVSSFSSFCLQHPRRSATPCFSYSSFYKLASNPKIMKTSHAMQPYSSTQPQAFFLCTTDDVEPYRLHCKTNPRRVVDALRFRGDPENTSNTLEDLSRSMYAAMAAANELVTGPRPSAEQKREWGKLVDLGIVDALVALVLSPTVVSVKTEDNVPQDLLQEIRSEARDRAFAFPLALTSNDRTLHSYAPLGLLPFSSLPMLAVISRKAL